MTESRPLLLNLPEVIETKRLTIEVPKKGDGVAVNAAILASLPELTRWSGWVHPTPKVDDSEEFIRKAIGQWHLRTQFSLVIRMKDTRRFIGCTGFHNINWKLGHFETGYWCHTPDSGNGYITEAMREMTKFAFRELNATRLEIRCDSENPRSLKVPERLGFKLEARLTNMNQRFDDFSMGTLLIYARTDLDGIEGKK